MNTIDMNMKLRRNLGKMLGDTEAVLNASMDILKRYNDNPKTFDIAIGLLKVYGVSARKLSNGTTVVFWLDDERVDDILSASLGELPEFLVNEDYEVRLLAMYRLEELNE